MRRRVHTPATMDDRRTWGRLVRRGAAMALTSVGAREPGVHRPRYGIRCGPLGRRSTHQLDPASAPRSRLRATRRPSRRRRGHRPRGDDRVRDAARASCWLTFAEWLQPARRRRWLSPRTWSAPSPTGRYRAAVASPGTYAIVNAFVPTSDRRGICAHRRAGRGSRRRRCGLAPSSSNVPLLYLGPGHPRSAMTVSGSANRGRSRSPPTASTAATVGLNGNYLTSALRPTAPRTSARIRGTLSLPDIRPRRIDPDEVERQSRGDPRRSSTARWARRRSGHVHSSGDTSCSVPHVDDAIGPVTFTERPTGRDLRGDDNPVLHATSAPCAARSRYRRAHHRQLPSTRSERRRRPGPCAAGVPADHGWRVRPAVEFEVTQTGVFQVFLYVQDASDQRIAVRLDRRRGDRPTAGAGHRCSRRGSVRGAGRDRRLHPVGNPARVRDRADAAVDDRRRRRPDRRQRHAVVHRRDRHVPARRRATLRDRDLHVPVERHLRHHRPVHRRGRDRAHHHRRSLSTPTGWHRPLAPCGSASFRAARSGRR